MSRFPLTPLFRSHLSANEWTQRYPDLHDAIEARRHITNPVSFDAFAQSMMNGDLNEVNRYIDEDGVEHDLTDTYGGAGLENSGESDAGEQGSESEDEAETVLGSDDEDEEMEPVDSAGIDADSDEHDQNEAATESDHPIREQTRTRLEDLSARARPLLNIEPLSTRIVLSHQSVGILRSFAQHGSKARLGADVLEFLSSGPKVRARGDRGGAEGDDYDDSGRDLLLRGASWSDVDRVTVGEEGRRAKTEKRRGWIAGQAGEGWVYGEDSSVQEGMMMLGHEQMRDAVRDAEEGGLEGQGRRASAQSWNSRASTLVEKEEVPPVLVHPPRVATPDGMHQISRDTTDPHVILAAQQWALRHIEEKRGRDIMRNLKHDMDTTAVHDAQAQDVNGTTPPYDRSLTTDPETHDLLSSMPFNPIGVTIHWDTTLGAPAFPPGYLDHLNQIYKLYNFEAQILLSYYVRKYSSPIYSPAPIPHNDFTKPLPVPHALFRLGITQLIKSRAEQLITPEHSHPEGLSRSARSLLRRAFEAHPTTEVSLEPAHPVDDEGSDNDSFISEVEDDEYWNRVFSKDDSDLEAKAFGYDDGSDPGGEYDDDSQKSVPELLRDGKLKVRAGLNPLEKEILARVAEVSVQEVESFWEQMRDKRKGWDAMRVWCRAQDREMMRRAKNEGWW